ncbi:MAG: hypothetical protein U9Q98_04020 [Bacteroidota bacterium]|nr:hypothetical protein [Bacteroidota bacterium]
MNKHVIISLTILFLMPLPGKAQKHCRHEAMEAEKVSYLTRNLDLTVMEAQKFWPVYNEYQDELEKNIMAQRNIMDKLDPEDSDLSNKELETKIDELIQLEVDKANIQKSFHQKFKKVLPINKLGLFYHYDKEFKRYLLRKFRNFKGDKHGSGPGAPPPRDIHTF